MKMTRQEMIERIDLFQGSKTYSYIKDIYGYFFNGYVIKRDEIKIILKDDEIGEIPIRIDDISEITYSKKHSFKREGKK